VEEDTGPAVVGFGDEVPAFMQLSPRVARRKPAEKEAES
jgi:hypothetical protein